MTYPTWNSWMKARKTNNPLIADFKDCISMDGGSDPWGSAMSWGFAACTWSEIHGVEIPSELGFSAGMAYETDSWEYRSIAALATGEDLVFAGMGEDAVKAAMPLALKVLNRYLNLLKLEGLDY